MKSRNPSLKHEWLLNWNLLIIIVGITLVLEVIVVLLNFPPEKKGYWIFGLSIAAAVIGFLGYREHNRQRKVLLYLQGIEPMRVKHAGSHLNLLLTVLISGSIFTGVSYVISEYIMEPSIPLYFSIPEITLGVMLTVTKNITAHELLGKTLLIRVSFIELYIPLDNIESVKADFDRLPDLPKDLKLPRRYRAVSSYFGYRVLITLKKLPPIKKTEKILFDVDDPDRFLTALLDRMPSSKGK
jgi:hypothetical protein